MLGLPPGEGHGPHSSSKQLRNLHPQLTLSTGPPQLGLLTLDLPGTVAPLILAGVFRASASPRMLGARRAGTILLHCAALCRQHPYGMPPVRVPATPVLIQAPTNTIGKGKADDPRAWTPASHLGELSHWGTQVFKILLFLLELWGHTG